MDKNREKIFVKLILLNLYFICYVLVFFLVIIMMVFIIFLFEINEKKFRSWILSLRFA